MSDTVLVALISLLGITVTGCFSVFVAKLNTTTKAMHAEVRSNNGKPTGEHVVELHHKVDQLAAQVRRNAILQRAQTKAVLALLVQHAEMDHGDSEPPRDGSPVQQEEGVRLPRRQGARHDSVDAA